MRAAGILGGGSNSSKSKFGQFYGILGSWLGHAGCRGPPRAAADNSCPNLSIRLGGFGGGAREACNYGILIRKRGGCVPISQDKYEIRRPAPRTSGLRDLQGQHILRPNLARDLGAGLKPIGSVVAAIIR